MVQWLRLPTPSAGVSDSTPGQGIKSHMPQDPAQPSKYFREKKEKKKRVKKKTLLAH